MIKTDDPKDENQAKEKTVTIVTTNTLKPKDFDFRPRRFPNVRTRPTRKVEGSLTLQNYEERIAATKKPERLQALKANRSASRKRGRKRK